MPQFNWPVMGPIVLILALVAGGAVFLGTHLPHPAAQVGRGTASPPQAAARASATPTGVQIPGRVIGTPHIRSDPSSNAIVLQDLQGGQTVQVTACSAGCAWYRVALPGQATSGWVSSAFVDVQGDEHKLPNVQ
jgi:uncharacterized iron-regulated membrane protein